MFKTENLSKRLIIAAAMLSVLLLAVFFLGTSANADDVDDAAEPAVLVDEYGRSADSGVIALKNTEYAGGPYFRLCLHGYQKLAPDATVTVTAYLPGTLIPFYRATFTKDYLVFKDTVNLIGGVGLGSGTSGSGSGFGLGSGTSGSGSGRRGSCHLESQPYQPLEVVLGGVRFRLRLR